MTADECVEKKFTIRNRLGLHARPAALFVRTANRFHSEVMVHKGKQKVNGKSIMGVMMLAASPGATIKVIAKGPDAAKAIAAIEALFLNNFGEN